MTGALLTALVVSACGDSAGETPASGGLVGEPALALKAEGPTVPPLPRFAGTGKTFYSAPGCSPHAPAYTLVVGSEEIDLTVGSGTGEGGKSEYVLKLSTPHALALSTTSYRAGGPMFRPPRSIPRTP